MGRVDRKLQSQSKYQDCMVNMMMILLLNIYLLHKGCNYQNLVQHYMYQLGMHDNLHHLHRSIFLCHTTYMKTAPYENTCPLHMHHSLLVLHNSENNLVNMIDKLLILLVEYRCRWGT